VAIFGHGGGSNKENSMTWVAASMANQGVATIIINSVGSGFGPLSTLTVNETDGESVTFLSGGRGIDQNGDHEIGSSEGQSATAPRAILGIRDAFRQTAVDLMQLVRVIEVGMDVDGNGAQVLDPSRIYYFGWSQGANFGDLMLAVEPNVHAGVLTAPGSPLIDNDRLAPGRRPGLGATLASRVPSLLNAPGFTMYAGLPVSAPISTTTYPCGMVSR
jgi:hypothetical protein